MSRTNADVQLRQKLRELGATLITEAAITDWHGDGATILVFGAKHRHIAADSLVLSTTSVPETSLSDELGRKSLPYDIIGDAVAARTAVMAIYEGRKLAMKL
jgi:hypothetical protein